MNCNNFDFAAGCGMRPRLLEIRPTGLSQDNNGPVLITGALPMNESTPWYWRDPKRCTWTKAFCAGDSSTSSATQWY